MLNLSEADLNSYLDTYIKRRYGKRLYPFFRGRVTGFSPLSGATTGPPWLVYVQRTGELGADGNQYLSALSSYLPAIGDDVDLVWRDDNTAYVFAPLSGSGAASTQNGTRFATVRPVTVAFTQPIPSWVRTLQIVYRARDVGASTVGQYSTVVVNGDVGANYSGEEVNSTNAITGTQVIGSTSMNLGICAGGGQSAGMVAAGIIWVPLSGVAGAIKGFTSHVMQNNGNTAGVNGPYTKMESHLWNNTGVVTSLTFTTQSAAAYSQPETVFDFYGWY